MRFAVVIAVIGGCLASPAIAGGSLPLNEVMDAVQAAPNLVLEIRAELEKQKLKADEVICAAERHGNQWTFIGGSRAAPYECEIGTHELTIDADRTYFDARGKSLGDLEHANPKRAKTFREENFRWQWK